MLSMSTSSTPIFQFSSVRFLGFGADNEGVAEFDGGALVGGYASGFRLRIAPLFNGQWQAKTLDWTAQGFKPPVLQSNRFVRELVNRAARLLDTTNLWPVAQEANGARMEGNQQVIPEEHLSHTCLSHRHGLLALGMSDWSSLWELIELRVEHDRYFEVLGYSREQIRYSVRTGSKLATDELDLSDWQTRLNTKTKASFPHTFSHALRLVASAVIRAGPISLRSAKPCKNCGVWMVWKGSSDNSPNLPAPNTIFALAQSCVSVKCFRDWSP